LIKYSLLVLT